MKPSDFQVKCLRTLKNLYIYWKSPNTSGGREEFEFQLDRACSWGFAGFSACWYLKEFPTASWKEIHLILTFHKYYETQKKWGKR